MSKILSSTDIVPLLTGRTPTKINRLFDHFLKEAGIPLTKEQWSVMSVLWEKEGCSQQELADKTFRDRASITRLLDNLQKGELISRKPTKNDRRTNLIYLTKEGKSLEAQIVEVLEKTINIITNNIDKKAIQQLRETFDKINQNIDALEIDKIL